MTPTLVEISEREVLAAAKRWRRGMEESDPIAHYGQFRALYEAIGLLIERERVEQSLSTGTVPQPDPPDMQERIDFHVQVALANMPELENLYMHGDGDGSAPVYESAGTWIPEFKCACGFEQVGGSAQVYNFCPHCGSPKEAVADSSTINDEGESGNASRLETLASPAQIKAYQSLDSVPPRPGESGNAPEWEYRTEQMSDVVAEGLPSLDLPMPRPGESPIERRPKKLSRKEQAIEERRKSDVSGRAAGRTNIDYSTDELPSAR
jgi:hypothetical protein